MDIRTIYLSRDYKKDFKTHREKFLDEWEQRHKKFIEQIKKKDEGIQDMLNLAIDKLLVIKVEIRDIKINITDNVTTQVPKIISFRIDKVTSFGCDANWQEISTMNMDKVFRSIRVTKLTALILNENEVFDLDESNSQFLYSNK